MSRGFVKEDDQEEVPIIPPRAALPNGETNYVTKKGLELLMAEKKELENKKSNIKVEDDQQRRRDLAIFDGKLNLLLSRIASARVLEISKEKHHEVRFGAIVRFKIDKNEQTFKIVGVDEANVKNKKIAFVAPIAKVITGKNVGDVISFKIGNETRRIEILEITYK